MSDLPANIKVSLVFSNHVPYQIGVLLQQVLHINLRRLVAGECGLQVESSLLDPLLQLGLVDVVLAALAAAEVEN